MMAAENIFSDAELLDLLKQDDRKAFEELYDRHWLSLYSAAYKRLNDKETCKDIVHDIFADLWDKRHERNIHDLKPYLHTSIRNKIFTLLSRGHAMQHFVEPFGNIAESPLTADGFFERKELRKLVLLLIETLPVKKREIIRLRFLEEFSTREIGEQLHISQKTVQNQLLGALNSMKARMAHFFIFLLGFLALNL